MAIYKVATTVAKIGGNEKIVQAQELIREALRLADKYPGPGRQQLINAVNHALQQLVVIGVLKIR